MATARFYYDAGGVTLAGLEELVKQVGAYSWIFEWGMFVLLLVAAGEAAWIFIDSSQKRKADKALSPRIMALVGVFFVLPAFIFRFTGRADGLNLAVRLMGENPPIVYPDSIEMNVKWLLAGYGPKVALLSLLGVAVSTLGAIVYASTVSRSRPSTEFISALNNQFGDLRQEIQSVKSRQTPAGGATTTMGPGAGPSTVAAPDPRRAAATMIDRPSGSAATIIERPGAGLAELRCVAGSCTGKVWKLPAGECKIGREGSNLVAVEDAKSSREHARIRFADGIYTVSDLGSSNGTFVNERQISGQTPLNDGDLVRIGDTTLAFKSAGV